MTQAAGDPSDAGIIATSSSPHAQVVPVPIGRVTIGDGFWKPWMEANRTKGIPALLAQLEEHGVVDNFRLVSGRKKGERQGPVFTDSDLYKWMEGAALVLQSTDDAALKKSLHSIIDDVAAAQREDGYLNTFFTGELAGQRFRNLGSEHELYCAGHLFQAAVAHYRATGERTLLNVATRYADFMAANMGANKIEQPDGHPEVEMALIELYRVTGKKDYLDLAGFYLKKQSYGENGQISGHAVRAAYLVAGAADYYSETGDSKARQAAEALWSDMATGRVYITGGLGARHEGEAIGERYELPNESAYAETCAAIANAMWNFRMLGNSGDAKYADMMERAFYNNVLSGISLDTTHWFYVNPLACFRDYQRSPWFGCTCCPTNAVRTLAAIPGYMYGVSDDAVWVHMYDSSAMDWRLGDGRKVKLEQKTRYPWDGRVEITVSPANASEFELRLRVPGWCRSASCKVNGKAVKLEAKPGSYLAMRREWAPGDKVTLDLKMPVELMAADPRVRTNLGKAAVQRGPLVYCFESPDNPAVNLADVRLTGSSFAAKFVPDLLGGVVTLTGKGEQPSAGDQGPLYRPVDVDRRLPVNRVTLVGIPAYAWANRGNSRMIIWAPYKP